MEEQLWEACKNGKIEDGVNLLQTSKININWQDSQSSRTALSITCEKGHIEELVSINHWIVVQHLWMWNYY